jgi:glycosyltransferase involved in cell wall biosynthesis
VVLMAKLSTVTRVCVVIPALNDSAMLAGCLAALAGQSRLPDEIVVVDNGSTDDTAAVARAAGATVIPEPLRGIFPATAAGFDAALAGGADLIARLDADSVPPADWIEHILREFDGDAGLTALSGPGDFYGSTPLIHWAAEHLYIGGYIWFVGLLLGHEPLFGSNLALRATAWRRLRSTVHRGMREIHDDLDLSIHIEPDMVTRFDRDLRVGVSARPFETFSGLARRVEWAFTTLGLNWRERSLLDRRAVRRAWQREQAAEAYS